MSLEKSFCVACEEPSNTPKNVENTSEVSERTYSDFELKTAPAASQAKSKIYIVEVEEEDKLKTCRFDEQGKIARVERTRTADELFLL